MAKKPCRGCGGDKEPGQRLWCLGCMLARLPPWEQPEYRQAVEGLSEARRTRAKPPAVPEGQRWCSGCSAGLPAARFRYPGNRCDICLAVTAHDRRLRDTYNISALQYQRLYDAQGGKCYICRARPGRVRLAVDHDHRCCKKGGSCGKCVRGLLCKRCNRNLLGAAHDDTDLLRRAISYLEHPPAKGML